MQAALFDLDGVLVSTDRFHYQAWKTIADQEKVYFDSEINHQLRGVSRMQSLEIILRRTKRKYSELEKETLCRKKNRLFRELIVTLTPTDWLAGSTRILRDLQYKGVKLALCSSSKNAQTILERLDGRDFFDVIIDGHDITATKPDPQIFLLAAEKLGVRPSECVVFEDAESGIEAAKRAGMRCVGIGDHNRLGKAEIVVKNLDEITTEEILRL